MLTFADLVAHPELLTDDLRSPIFHADGTMTVLWEGPPVADLLYAQGEWMAQPAPLIYLEECDIWGADLPAPPLPRTVCSWVRVGADATFLRTSLPSWRHTEALLGPDLPPLPAPPALTSPLFAELRLPSPGLATAARRIHLFAPGATYRDALYVLDGDAFAGPEADFPAAMDALTARGEAPPTLIVAVNGGGADRHAEYLATGARNAALHDWFTATLVPHVAATYGVERHWLVGTSNAASFALQLVLGTEGVFAGAVCCSPWHRDGYPTVAALAEGWIGGARIFLSHGDFGYGETATLPQSRALAATLTRGNHSLRYHEAHGYGHVRASWSRIFPDGLRWLFSSVPQTGA